MNRRRFLEILALSAASAGLNACVPWLPKSGNVGKKEGLPFILSHSGDGWNYLDRYTFNGIAGNDFIYRGSVADDSGERIFHFMPAGERTGNLLPARFAPDHGESKSASIVDVVNTLYDPELSNETVQTLISSQYKQLGFELDPRYIHIERESGTVQRIRYDGPGKDESKLIRPLKREWEYLNYKRYGLKELEELRPDIKDLPGGEAKLDSLLKLPGKLPITGAEPDSVIVPDLLNAFEQVKELQTELSVLNHADEAVHLNRFIYDMSWRTERQELFEIKESHEMDEWNSRRTAEVFHLTDSHGSLMLPVHDKTVITVPEKHLRKYSSWKAGPYETFDGRKLYADIPVDVFVNELKYGLELHNVPVLIALEGLSGSKTKFSDDRPMIAPGGRINDVIVKLGSDLLEPFFDYTDRANAVADFVQRVPYVHDFHSYQNGLDPLIISRKTVEKSRFPLAVLTAKGDDCEGQAVLLAALAQVGGLDQILIYETQDASSTQEASNIYLPANQKTSSTSHLFNGLAVAHPGEGIMYKGKKYIYADGTQGAGSFIGNKRSYKDEFPVALY